MHLNKLRDIKKIKGEKFTFSRIGRADADESSVWVACLQANATFHVELDQLRRAANQALNSGFASAPTVDRRPEYLKRGDHHRSVGISVTVVLACVPFSPRRSCLCLLSEDSRARRSWRPPRAPLRTGCGRRVDSMSMQAARALEPSLLTNWLVQAARRRSEQAYEVPAAEGMMSSW